MLDIYSQLINSDDFLSIDWHSQFLALVKGLAIICVDNPFVRDRFFASDTTFLCELYDAEYQQALGQTTPVAAQDTAAQHSHQLWAVAVAKMKILAYYEKTQELIHVWNTNEIVFQFSTFEQTVHDLFAAENSTVAQNNHFLELFSDSLCLYFNCLVESSPLIKRGLSPFCSAIFSRTKKILLPGSTRHRNAERVCKIAKCLYDSSVDSCRNHAFFQNWTGIKDLNVDDFVIEPVVDVQGEPAIAEPAHAGGEEPDEVQNVDGDVAPDFDIGVRPPIFRKSTDFRDFIEFLVQTRPFGLYHRILAHDGLDCTEWRSRIKAITKDAHDAVEAVPNAVTCVFVDEMNTANSLGLISEAFSNHSMDGEPLPASLFFVGAINPLIKNDVTVHQEHLGINDYDEKAMREFIVRPLPPCLSQMVHEWVKFSSEMEKAFLEEYIEKRHLRVFLTKVLSWEAFVREGPLDLCVEINRAYEREHFQQGDVCYAIVSEYRKIAVELIVACQQIINEYSSRKLLLRVRPSIRDILRCVNMWYWILAQQLPSESDDHICPKKDSVVNPYLPENVWCVTTEPGLSYDSIVAFVRKRLRQALYAAVAICYYIQLPVSVKDPLNSSSSIQLRLDFSKKLQRQIKDDPTDPYPINFLKNWRECVEHLWSYATKPPGIAHTNVLKETFYAVVVALHVKPTMPLLITGPAGMLLLHMNLDWV